MSFLNSAFLFGLLAVSIPLIIHFLSRRRILTVDFSSLKFLEQMQKSRMKWLRIKEILLLLLRMAVIALVVLAFSRPTLRGFAGASKASSSVAIILDRSASMETQGQTGSIFDEARRITGRFISSLEPADQVTVIPSPAEGQQEPPTPLNPGERLQKSISYIESGYSSGNMGEAVKSALGVLKKSQDINREIYVISDFQKSEWNDLPADIFDAGLWNGVNLSCVPISPAGPDNVGITDVLLPPQMLVPGENFEIEAELVNYGSGTLENVLVGVVVDGERKAQSNVSLRPGQPTRVPFRFKLDRAGRHGAWVEIDYDRYSLDNRRYFTLDIPDHIRLLTVGQSDEALRFISLALNRPEAGQLSFKGIGAGDLLREDLSLYDVILLHDLKSLDPARQAAVERFVENGGGLFVSLGPSTDPGYWKGFLNGIAGITPGEMAGSEGEYIIWDDFDFEHPIFSVYSPGGDRSKPFIPDIHIVRYTNLKGGRILGSSSGGVNLLAESEKSPILVFASGLDLSSGDLPAHSFFIPFIVRSVEYLGSRSSGAGDSGIIGKMFALRTAEATGELKLISPAGDQLDINPAASGGQAMIRFTVETEPGIYKLLSDSSTAALIAFNVDSKESSGETISPAEIGNILGVNANKIEPGSDIVTSIREARFGRELWKEFLIAALILLIVESILGRTSPPAKSEQET